MITKEGGWKLACKIAHEMSCRGSLKENAKASKIAEQLVFEFLRGKQFVASDSTLVRKMDF